MVSSIYAPIATPELSPGDLRAGRSFAESLDGTASQARQVLLENVELFRSRRSRKVRGIDHFRVFSFATNGGAT